MSRPQCKQIYNVQIEMGEKQAINTIFMKLFYAKYYCNNLGRRHFFFANHSVGSLGCHLSVTVQEVGLSKSHCWSSVIEVCSLTPRAD